MKHILNIKVNGRPYEVAVSAKTLLSELLRDQLDLTGTKIGCGEGECGACTVLIDGVPMSSCIVLALEVEGKEITTIEGMADGQILHPVQKAFIEQGAIQCGFCSPGMILTSKALLDTDPNPSETEIRSALAGNLCRCTGYQKIVEAVDHAARGMSSIKGEVK
ncbi:MAG: (2Fe-2S)-binding protein [Proteobacteria bacterium]|nr:(2Fe-2S)-binding protein [Pseudomonadota bacterium]